MITKALREEISPGTVSKIVSFFVRMCKLPPRNAARIYLIYDFENMLDIHTHAHHDKSHITE